MVNYIVSESHAKQDRSDLGCHSTSTASTTMKYDPNFPADLEISPSHHPQPSSLPSADASQNVFGSFGQQESIRNYGIAGRVW
jgi:hypothetical protein